jgi:flavin-dependent dehydrogenase
VNLNMNTSTDVLIIGGGPGGTAAAIAAAHLGLSVTLLESQPFPRHRPGETLHPGMEPLLRQLGVLEPVCNAGFLRHLGYWVEWHAERQFMPFGGDEEAPWQGFQAWRADFDSILLHKAEAFGVRVIQPCRSLRAISCAVAARGADTHLDRPRIIGIETTRGEFYGDYIIDATGGNHWLSRHMHLPIEYYSPRLIAHYGYVQGICTAYDDAPAIAADPEGWTWIARVRPQIYQWTRLVLTEQKLPKDWRPAELQGLETYQKTRTQDVSWRKVEQPAGAGYFMVGDAAMVLDPASSHGVLKAIMSGMMAAHLIGQMQQDRRLEQQAIEQYCQWIGDWCRQDVLKLRELYGQLPNAPEWV